MKKRILAVTFFGLVLTPVFYVAVQALVERRRRAARPTRAYAAKLEEETYA